MTTAAPDFRSLLKRNDRNHFRRLIVGKFGLSVQASDTAYSTPRLHCDEPTFYSEFEVAAFEDDNWLCLATDARFADLDLKDLWETENECPVGGYVPVATVQAIWQRMHELAKVTS